MVQKEKRNREIITYKLFLLLMPLFRQTLLEHQASFASLLPFDLKGKEVMRFDLSQENSQLLYRLDIRNSALMSRLMFRILRRHQAKVGVGGYLEHRMIYARSENFDAKEPRRLHLGIDLWTAADTPIMAPLAGTVHSFQNNAIFGDYGPTIILEHHLAGQRFYTLYGHLSLDSLEGLYEGKEIQKGEIFARIGNYPINGDWPPHLHFQLIRDMRGKKGDFFGVCAFSEKKYYASLCPDPNLILGIPALEALSPQ